ncbi:MAG TPA: acetolactate synthase small subunit [Myxococcales bacterium]|jgi:acetolactate synthase I/III small subunit
MGHESAFSIPAGRKIAQTLIAYVEDQPGTLNRIVSLFRRRGFNIESLTVGRTEREGVSRITVVVRADDDTAHRLEANLYKLVNVLSVEDVTHTPSVTREMAFVKVRAAPDRRAELLQLVQTFRARVVDLGPESVIVETTGTQEKLDGLIEILRPFGIIELVRTGAVAMLRGPGNGAQVEASESDDGVAA